VSSRMESMMQREALWTATATICEAWEQAESLGSAGMPAGGGNSRSCSRRPSSGKAREVDSFE